MEAGEDFPDEAESVENTAIRNVMAGNLHKAMDKLSDFDREFIHTLFFSNGGSGMTERECADLLEISQPSVNERKRRILTKLKNILGN